MENIIELLAEHPEPSVRYRLAVGVRGLSEESREVAQLRLAVKDSPRVKAMLAARDSEGRFPWHAYQKFNGAFWTFLVLADIGYPVSDETLIPLREQIFDWLFDPRRLKAIPLINGRWRRCACQEGGAVFSLLRLGLVDTRVEQLVQLLLKWQWPDGGWNCDKRPDSSHSSFHEPWIPLRALNAFWLASSDEKVKTARDYTVERLLSRSLYKKPATGEPIKPDFEKLAYPGYWHYDILYGLRTMTECGLINDPRCQDGLDLLESKRLTDGGFGTEVKYYHYSHEVKTGRSLVDWGGTSKQYFNPFVTTEAFYVLKAAGRL